MIKEFCDGCGKEFKYPILKGGIVRFTDDEAWDHDQLVLCTECYNRVRASLMPVYSESTGIKDMDDAMYDAYEEQQERVLANDEMSGEPI